MVSRRPFWPPWPPSNFSRAVPGGRSSSSWASRHCFGLDLPVAQCRRHRRGREVHEGGRFQQPDVLARRCVIFAVSPCSFVSSPKRAPGFSASASINQNPALCRVRACSAPGLPRPTMRRSPAMSKIRIRRRGRGRTAADAALLLLRRRRGGRSGCRLGRPWSTALRAAASARIFLGFFAGVLGDDDGQVMLLAELQRPAGRRPCGSLSSDRWMMSPSGRAPTGRPR